MISREDVKVHCYAVNRQFRAEDLLINLVRTTQGRTHLEVYFSDWLDLQAIGEMAEIKAICRLMVEHKWLADTVNFDPPTTTVLPAGRDRAMALMRKSSTERQQDYLLKLIHTILNGSLNEYFQLIDLNELSLLRANENARILRHWMEEGFLRMEVISPGEPTAIYLTQRGARYIEDLNKEKPSEVFAAMPNIQNITIQGNASNFNIGEKGRISITNQTGLSGTEVTNLINEVGATIRDLKQSDQLMIEGVLRHIGRISEDPASQEEALTVATLAQSWLAKATDKTLDHLSPENLIAFAKALMKGEISLDNLLS